MYIIISILIIICELNNYNFYKIIKNLKLNKNIMNNKKYFFEINNNANNKIGRHNEIKNFKNKSGGYDERLILTNNSSESLLNINLNTQKIKILKILLNNSISNNDKINIIEKYDIITISKFYPSNLKSGDLLNEWDI